MVDFVLHYSNTHKATKLEFHSMARNYVKFLKQPLTLGMFVPAKLVNGVWVVLEDPIPKSIGNCINKRKMIYESIYDEEELKEYQEAKDRVIFNIHLVKGNAKHLHEIWNDEKYLFTYNESTNLFLTVGSTVESLIKYNLVLTESAKKKLSL